MTTEKVIGVMPLYDDERESYWMLPGYMRMLEEENAVPLMLPLTDNKRELDFFLKICGGFLMTGGHDVSPEMYGSFRGEGCGPTCRLRDKTEAYILENAVKLDKSVLGICRGIQLMNVLYGGTLYQDLESEYKQGANHHMSPPYDRTAHTVRIIKGSFLYEILGKEEIGVNSYHHQAIKDLSASFSADAVSCDGLTEGISMPSKKFVVGVQWHPEFSYETDENSKKIIKAFVRSI